MTLINLIPQYLSDYWYITLLTLIQTYLLLKIKYIPSEKSKIIFHLIFIFNNDWIIYYWS